MRKIVILTKLRVVLWAMLGPTFFPRSPLIIEPKLSDILHCILSLLTISLSLSLAALTSQTSPSSERMAASEHIALQFGTSSASLSAKIHSLVIFNICDCYVRRPDQAERVIGTLLGSILPDGTVDIRNSYAVPHSESSDQVFLYPEFTSIFAFFFF